MNDKRKIRLAPSILSADFKYLYEEVSAVERAGASYLHIDVMDGQFVPAISFGCPVIKCIRSESNLIFDVHLMIINPVRYIKQFSESGADSITFHLEATSEPQRVISEIRNCGCKVGISIKPKTPLENVLSLLPDVDLLLIMSVEPGFGGQSYIADSTLKIRKAREYIDGNGLSVDLQVDGGIKRDNAKTVINAGANVLVAGSSIFNGDTFHSMSSFMDAITI